MPRPSFLMHYCRLLIVACSLHLVLPATLIVAQSASPGVYTPVPAASTAPLTVAERDEVLDQLAKELEAKFVFPDVAASYAKMLRERKQANAYADLSDPIAFAAKVTADLQAVSADGHLRLNFNPSGDFSPGRTGPPRGAPREALAETRMISGFAYLKFSSFPNDPEVAARARQFLLDHTDARGVILDARDSRGGTTMVMDAILPLFFAERATLMRMDTREGAGPRGPRPPASGAPGGGPSGSPGSEVREGPPPTMVRQKGPAGIERFDHIVLPDPTEKQLQKVPVFYLTSKLTRSAAEHFAMALQRTHRGVVVGETTAGAGNFGAPVPIGTRFSAFIPFGRSYDPDTNRGWEGTGITPDVSVSAPSALDEALRRGEAL
ncbi:MAG: hypothetical protein DMF06_12505 [Verrucomicrobia bacterium]|nr:MAG: hypothetical protein DMF06_12505 [Verrucomicrobiota bacterium]